MEIKRKAHIFNLDNLLIDIDQKVWIIQKNDPNNCIMRISKDIFDSIKNGSFISKDLSMSFNDKTYYLDESTFEELKKKVKIKADDDELSFSFREFIDPNTIQNLEINYNYECVKHLKNTNDDIFFVATKGTDRKYGHIYNKLIDNLKEEFGLIVNQVYYLNQSFFGQNKDYNIKKLIYVILSNLVGKQIEDNKFTEDLDRDYTEVHFYDTNYVTINKIDVQLPDFMKKLGVENLRRKKVILDLVGSNKLKPFKSREIEFGMDYIKAFESFKKKDKTKLGMGALNEKNLNFIKFDPERPFTEAYRIIPEYVKDEIDKWRKILDKADIKITTTVNDYNIFRIEITSDIKQSLITNYDGSSHENISHVIIEYRQFPEVRILFYDDPLKLRHTSNYIIDPTDQDIIKMVAQKYNLSDNMKWMNQLNESVEEDEQWCDKSTSDIKEFLEKCKIKYEQDGYFFSFKNREYIIFIGPSKFGMDRESFVQVQKRSDDYDPHNIPNIVLSENFKDIRKLIKLISPYIDVDTSNWLKQMNESVELNYKFQRKKL